MKKSLLIIACIVITLSAHAQITLDFSNAPSVAQCQIPDTMDRIKTNSLPDVTPKANTIWDITTATDSSTFTRFFNHGAASSAFPTAKFVIPGHYAITTGLQYQIETMYDLNTNGIVRIGEHIDRQPIPLAALTGNTNDSIVFVAQDIFYSVPEHEVKYPCTMGTKWTDDQIYTTKFNLTVASAGLNDVPSERKTNRILNYEVVGWGKMRVNDSKGDPTKYEDVLLIQRTEVTIDSFFIGGSPAPANLLAAFNLTQGQQLSTYQRHFYRSGEFRGLLEVEYESSAFMTKKEILKHRQRLEPVSINTVKQEQIRVYPNPVTNKLLTIKVDGEHTNLSYQLFNMTGQMVSSGMLPSSGQIHLQNNLPTGNYVFKLGSDDGAYGLQRVSIVK